MRNLAEYPVEYGEVEQNLKDMQKAYSSKMLLGDMRPLILSYLIEYLQLVEVQEDFTDWLKWKQNMLV